MLLIAQLGRPGTAISDQGEYGAAVTADPAMLSQRLTEVGAQTEGHGLHGARAIEEMINRTKSVYDGSILVGEDLMTFEIDENNVKLVTRARAFVNY